MHVHYALSSFLFASSSLPIMSMFTKSTNNVFYEGEFRNAQHTYIQSGQTGLYNPDYHEHFDYFRS
jgi:hypothetical protein